MATVRPSELPAAASVATSAAFVVDTGSSVEKATAAQIIDAAIPLASQAEAEAGANNTKRVTPLRVKQAIDALSVSASKLAATGGGEGSAIVGFKQSGTGAVARTVQDKARDILSVKDFGAAGDGATDDTAAINAAIAYAKTTAFEERTINFPAGDYWVSQINLRNCSYITFHAEGTVNITGNDDTAGFIVGDDRLDELGHTEDFARQIRFTGGPWLITSAPGEVYQRGLKLQNIVDSVFENLSVSGTFTPTGGTGNRVTVEIDLSFNNAFHNCTFSRPGAPIGADKSYALWMGSDNVNNNRFYNYRSQGANATEANTIGARVDGSGNCFYGGDISAIHTVFELNNARGCHFLNMYHESVSRIVNVSFASRGCVFMPSYADVMANGTAYDLGGDSGTVQTVGFQIIGGNHKFNASGTTGLKKGSNCYALTYQPATDTTALPATVATGTDRGSGGSTLLNGFETSTAKLNFPDVYQPSANPTTLDCYAENIATLQPVVKLGTNVQPINAASSYYDVVKVGRLVTVNVAFLVNGALVGTGRNAIEPSVALPAGWLPRKLTAFGVSTGNINHTGNLSGWITAAGVIQLLVTTTGGARSILDATNFTASSEAQFSFSYIAVD